MFLQQFAATSSSNYLLLVCVIAFFLSLAIGLVGGNFFINRLVKMQFSQTVRDDGPKTHLTKSGTPTMGGLIILFSFLISSFVVLDYSKPYVLLFTFLLFAYGGIGFLDDYIKTKKNKAGLSPRAKYALQSVSLFIVVFILYFFDKHFGFVTQIQIPFVRNLSFDIGFLHIFLMYLVIVGSSNALNLTDGLDGLAASSTVIVLLGLAVLAYLVGDPVLAKKFGFFHVEYGHDLLVICMLLAGSCAGFLKFNSYPARIFMGDVGSLSLGAALGFIAICLHQEFLFALMAIVFVAETLSVMIQILSYKYRNRKRVFLMAPLHHHFELKGWAETKVVFVFVSVSFFAVLLCLAIILLR